MSLQLPFDLDIAVKESLRQEMISNNYVYPKIVLLRESQQIGVPLSSFRNERDLFGIFDILPFKRFQQLSFNPHVLKYTSCSILKFALSSSSHKVSLVTFIVS